MTLWEAALLGVIQGLTEFLPISSTAHLLVARQMLGHEKPEDAFTTVIQMGTLVAVLWYFRRDIGQIVVALWGDWQNRRFGSSPESRLAWLIALGSVPVVVIGLTLKKWIKSQFYDIHTMAVVAILFAMLMLAAELWHKIRRDDKHLPEVEQHQVGWRIALWVGFWQALALMPGASRSGTTITGGLFAGLSRSTAARFSFLLSIPSITGAGLKELYDERKVLLGSQDQLIPLIVATVVSGIVGYAAIAFLLNFLKKYSMNVFVVYRILLGVGLLTALGLGWLRG